MIEQIKKNDGTTVDFDSSIITSDIEKVGEKTGEFGEREARKLTLRLLTLFHDLRFGPIVEQGKIQDLIERVLFDSPYYETAKAFVVQRYGLSTEAVIAEYMKKMEKERMKLCSVCLKEDDNLMKINENTRFKICRDCADELPIILDEKGLLNRIKKSITFTPETKQAGMAILAYFGEILEKKYPDLNTKVKIEQENLKVTMIVETPEGEVEKIEKALENYGLVIMGKQNPKKLLENQYDIMLLQQKLEIANLEIKQKTELLQMARLDIERHNKRIDSFEQQIKSFQELIGQNMILKKNEQEFLLKIIERYSLNSEIAERLEFVITNFESGNFLRNEKKIKESLEIINGSHPSVIKEIYNFTKNTVSGLTANIIFNWIAPFLNSIPK